MGSHGGGLNLKHYIGSIHTYMYIQTYIIQAFFAVFQTENKWLKILKNIYQFYNIEGKITEC